MCIFSPGTSKRPLDMTAATPGRADRRTEYPLMQAPNSGPATVALDSAMKMFKNRFLHYSQADIQSGNRANRPVGVVWSQTQPDDERCRNGASSPGALLNEIESGKLDDREIDREGARVLQQKIWIYLFYSLIFGNIWAVRLTLSLYLSRALDPLAEHLQADEVGNEHTGRRSGVVALKKKKKPQFEIIVQN